MQQDMLIIIGKIPKGLKELWCFDLDGTLIRPKSGNKFPKDSTDWKYAYPNVKQVLESKPGCGIITNQRWKKTATVDPAVKHKQVADKIRDIMADIPTLEWAIIATTAIVGKPEIYIAEEHLIPAEPSEIHYVGDACGRFNDHSDDDFRFYRNINLFVKCRKLPIKPYFYTPEDIFMTTKKIANPEECVIRGFNPTLFVTNLERTYDKRIISSEKTETPRNAEFLKDMRERIKQGKKTALMLIGPPTSGKSTLVEKLGVPYVSKDAHTTRCAAVFQKLVVDNTFIAVDNTNPTAAVRKVYSTVGFEIINVLVAGNYFKTVDKITDEQCLEQKLLAMHIGKVRLRRGGKDVDAIAYSVYYSKFNKDRASLLVDKTYIYDFIPKLLNVEAKLQFLMY